MKNKLERGAGILCHISSLPNKYGIGTLGKEAYGFADFLKMAHVKYWQVLPLVQTGFGDSPYSSVACNSGNPLFIDLEGLRDEGLLSDEELKFCYLPVGDVDYEAVVKVKFPVLRLAYSRFDIRDEEFVKFVESGEFEDYALFMSLKSRYGGSFDTFPDPYKYRDDIALKEFKAKEYGSEYCFWLFLQFVFKKQWLRLKNYVNSLGIKIIGDIPLYVAYDSADVWAKPGLFQLDGDLKPVKVAGVPPDYFSKTGQLWGNPLYNWDVMAENGYEWWTNRMEHCATMFDVVRIDHFRGFDRFWAIPAESETAETGAWEEGPKEELFNTILNKIGDFPVIAEDLGIIDSGVVRLRTNTGFPGMKVLLFAFDGSADNPHLPKHISENCAVYTGTHDNDTALGFLKAMTDVRFAEFKRQLMDVINGEGIIHPFSTRTAAVRAMCMAALASRAKLAILPVQDLLGLDNSARMNCPSVAQGNWKFRLDKIPSRYFAAVMRKAVKEYKR